MAKRNVQCSKPADPPFLQKLKEKCGFTQTTIETKRQAPQMDPDAHEDGDDERPQVVVLRAGDLTQDEADKIFGKGSKSEDTECSTSKKGSKLEFSTKSKRSADESSSDLSETKKIKSLGDPKRKNDVKAVKNSNLLSFDEDGDDEDC